MSLNHTKILLGVTGGIAAYKSAELCRLLVKAGADVRVAMTNGAQQFVTPLTFQALSGKPVLTSLWQGANNGMDHIEASRDANLILVAPASATAGSAFTVTVTAKDANNANRSKSATVLRVPGWDELDGEEPPW